MGEQQLTLEECITLIKNVSIDCWKYKHEKNTDSGDEPFISNTPTVTIYDRLRYEDEECNITVRFEQRESGKEKYDNKNWSNNKLVYHGTLNHTINIDAKNYGNIAYYSKEQEICKEHDEQKNEFIEIENTPNSIRDLFNNIYDAIIKRKDTSHKQEINSLIKKVKENYKL